MAEDRQLQRLASTRDSKIMGEDDGYSYFRKLACYSEWKVVSSEIQPIKQVAPNAVYEAEVLSGVPDEISKRSVKIFRPAKTAMQSGTSLEKWVIDFDTEQRWNNELMGWSSSADTVQSLRIKFDTREAAILFAERQGYNYKVEEPKEAKFKVRTYASNFKFNSKKLTWFHTK